jgi:hypothetical protein
MGKLLNGTQTMRTEKEPTPPLSSLAPKGKDPKETTPIKELIICKGTIRHRLNHALAVPLRLQEHPKC